jgi:hypothetical protein
MKSTRFCTSWSQLLGSCWLSPEGISVPVEVHVVGPVSGAVCDNALTEAVRTTKDEPVVVYSHDRGAASKHRSWSRGSLYGIQIFSAALAAISLFGKTSTCSSTSGRPSSTIRCTSQPSS